MRIIGILCDLIVYILCSWYVGYNVLGLGFGVYYLGWKMGNLNRMY